MSDLKSNADSKISQKSENDTTNTESNGTGKYFQYNILFLRPDCLIFKLQNDL
jgi:hypothetical protein